MPLTPTTPPPAGQPLTSGADPGRDTAPHSDTDGLHDHWSDGLNPSQSESEAKPAPAWVNDPFIVGIATDDPAALPEPTGLPVFRLDAPEALLDHLLASGERYQYTQGHHG